jgi:hypothetical protein
MGGCQHSRSEASVDKTSCTFRVLSLFVLFERSGNVFIGKVKV